MMGLRTRYREVMANRHPWWRTKAGKDAWGRIKFFAFVGLMALVVFFIGTFDILTLGLDAVVIGVLGLLILILIVEESHSARLDILTWDLEQLLEVPLGVPRGKESD